MIVVDTNVIAYCFIRGERTGLAQRVRLRDSAWHVPILWRSELRSTLAGYMWRDGMDTDWAAPVMAEAERVLFGCEHAVSSNEVLELASSSRVSAYDCEFVVLAQALSVPLVTEDRALIKAFPEVAISMEDFLEKFPGIPPAAHEKRGRYRVSRSAQRQR